VNATRYINLGLHRVTIHIHMFPMSHKLPKSVNISQRYKKGNLTDICGYFDVITISRIYTPLSRFARVGLKCVASSYRPYMRVNTGRICLQVHQKAPHVGLGITIHQNSLYILQNEFNLKIPSDSQSNTTSYQQVHVTETTH
jgi:hypothetical protein